MKTVGLSVAYSMVPFDESDTTADNQIMVEAASTLSLMLDDPKNGSLITSN